MLSRDAAASDDADANRALLREGGASSDETRSATRDMAVQRRNSSREMDGMTPRLTSSSERRVRRTVANRSWPIRAQARDARSRAVSRRLWIVALGAMTWAVVVVAPAAQERPAAKPAPRAQPRTAQPRPEEASQPRRTSPGGSAVNRGQRLFTQSCAFCHGADARGGAQGGVDLLQSPIVLEDRRRSPSSAQFLAVGRPEKNMPKFDLPRQQVAEICRLPARAR